MEVQTTRFWKEHFARSASWHREQDYLERQKREQREKQRKEDKLEDDVMDAAQSLMLASAESIADFKLTLDTYDTATVSALMENQRQRELVQEQIDEMLGEAHVLPDVSSNPKTVYASTTNMASS